MNRRSLFKGLAGVAAGLILPPTLEENAEAGKRIWALGGIPQGTEYNYFHDLRIRPMSAIDRFLEPVDTPLYNKVLMRAQRELEYAIIHNRPQYFEHEGIILESPWK